MLNDLSTFTRTSLFVQTFGPGLALGAILMPGVDRFPTALVVAGVGMVLMLTWMVWHIVAIRRAERRLWAEVSAGSQEIVAGSVAAVRAPGRVVRRRVRGRDSGYLLSRGHCGVPAVGCAVTVIGAGRRRRVGVLVPGGVGLMMRNTPVLVAAHPTRHEVAVLDDRVSRAELDAIAADPRFCGDDVPTDRSVLGGYPMLGLMAVAGLLSGGLLGFALVRLLG